MNMLEAIVLVVKNRQLFAAFSDLFYYAEHTLSQKRLRSYRSYAAVVRKMHFSPAIVLGYFGSLMGVGLWTLIG